MIGVSGSVKDLSCNSDLAEELTALLEGDDDVAFRCNLNIVVLRLCPGLHNWDGVNLDIKYEKGYAFPL